MFTIRNKKTGLFMKEIGPIQNLQKLVLQWTKFPEEGVHVSGFDSEEAVEGWKNFQKMMGVELELVEA